jgi:hypothetical protein
MTSARRPYGLGRGVIRVALLLLAAAGAAGGAVSQFSVATTSGPATKQTELWHAFGLLFFALLFCLLAWRPRSLPGLWEVTIAVKAALGVAEVAIGIQGATNGTFDGVVDLVLAGFLLVAYVTSRAYLAWRQPATH